jgi:hypothetical protein
MARRAYLLAALLMVAAGMSVAGDTIGVRLVEAHSNGEGVDQRLADVGKLLKGHVPYARFDLLDSRTIRVPEAGTATLREGIVLRCSGSRKNLSVQVERKGTRLLSTTLSLSPGRPLVLGGFRGGRGKLLLVLIADR